MPAAKFWDGTVWQTIAAVQGPTGPQGPKGDTGATGGNATVPMDPWHQVGAAGEPAFLNSWQAIAAGYEVYFRKDPLGRVWVRGCVGGPSGAVGLAAFQLPVGYRPLKGIEVVDSTNNAYGRTAVDINGYVIPNTSTTNHWLNSVQFDTESVTAMPTGPQGPKGDTGATGGNATVPMDTWHTIGAAGEPAFAVAGWKHYGTGFQSVGFRKDPLGRVYLRGLLGAQAPVPAIGATIFTLPSGYTPKTLISMFATFDLGTYIVRIDVYPGGAVVLAASTGGIVNATSFYPLEGISFDTESVTAMPTGPKGDTGATGGNATVPMEDAKIVSSEFLNGFTNQPGSSSAYRKDPLGKVMLRGYLKNTIACGTGGGSTSIMQLPVGYRPAVDQMFKVQIFEANGLNTSGTLEHVMVQAADGIVRFAGSVGPAWTGVINSFIRMDEIDFDTGTVTAMPTGPQGPPGPIGVVQDEGTALAAQSAINFVGAGVAATNDAANGRSRIAIPGGLPGYSMQPISLSFGTMTAGTELEFSFSVPWTTSMMVFGGFAGGAINSAGPILMSWMFNPISPGNLRVIVRNNSPYNMGSGGAWVGCAFYI